MSPQVTKGGPFRGERKGVCKADGWGGRRAWWNQNRATVRQERMERFEFRFCAEIVLARVCTSAKPKHSWRNARVQISNLLQPKQKGMPDGHPFLLWRRWRDLNSRAGFPTYTLSRGASSPTWVLLRISRWITKSYLFANILYIIFIVIRIKLLLEIFCSKPCSIIYNKSLKHWLY